MKKATRTLGGLVPLGLSFILAACSTSDTSDLFPAAPSPSAAAPDSGGIEVAPHSRMALALRGGLGPIIEGQTIKRAMVTIEDVELVSTSGTSVTLVHDSITTDLLAIQNELQQLLDQRTIQSGQFSRLRFRLRSAWIESVDSQNVTHVFASELVDRTQFAPIADVRRLDLSGIESDGFVTVALPESGIFVRGTTTVALHFALSESLSVHSSEVWVLSPRVWAVDTSIFSSLDVHFEATSESFSQFLSQGFEVMVFDAGMRPISSVSLAVISSTHFSASFRFLEFFQGPFVCVLLPPSGFWFESSVAVSLELHQSVRAETHISVTSVQEVSRTETSTTLDVRTSEQAVATETTSAGEVLSKRTWPVGPLDQIAKPKRTAEPVRPGEQRPPPSPLPVLPGLPPPRNVQPDGGAPPPPADAGAPPADAGAPPPHADAGAPPPPPHVDAGAPPPHADAGVPPPHADAGAPPPHADAGVPPPHADAGAPPPHHEDAGVPPPPHHADAGAPPPPPHHEDAGAPPPPHHADAGPPPPPPHHADAGPPPPPPHHADAGAPRPHSEDMGALVPEEADASP